jgi:dienelactone hydrolase
MMPNEGQEIGEVPLIAPESELPGEREQLQTNNKNGGQAKFKRNLRLRNILARALLVLLFTLGFFLSVLPWGRATIRTLFLLPEVLSASQPGLLTLAEEPIQHTQTTVPSLNGTVFLDVYAPTKSPPPIPGAREGLVVIPGAGDERAEPQLINFSQALARAGLVVMDMTTPTLLNWDLSAHDSDAVVQAFKTLARWPGVGANRIGIVGFSAGDALACFAAADPRIRDQVAFIVLFGGYFNATTLLHDVGRRALTVDGRVESWQPQYVPIQVLANVIAHRLPPSEGPRLVKALAPGGKPLPPEDLAQLSPDTVASYHLLAGEAPDQVDAHIAALSPAIHSLLDELSPSRVIDKIRAPIYLLHDRSDQFVPFTESQDFAAALTRIHHPHDFVGLGIFQHTEVKAGVNLGQLAGDTIGLFRILNAVLLPST